MIKIAAFFYTMTKIVPVLLGILAFLLFGLLFIGSVISNLKRKD